MNENRSTGRRWLVAALFVVGFAGCARGGDRGPVIGTVNDREFYVALGSGQVEAGQRVDVFRQTCENVAPDQQPSGCKDIRIGTGTVTQVLDDGRSVVRLDPGTPSIAEGGSPPGTM